MKKFQDEWRSMEDEIAEMFKRIADHIQHQANTIKAREARIDQLLEENQKLNGEH